jgi:hypothetical protein
MIAKAELKGKPVSFVDRDGKFRICKVYIINGRTLTVGVKVSINGYKFRTHWERIHPDKNRIFGAIIRKKLVEIQW